MTPNSYVAALLAPVIPDAVTRDQVRAFHGDRIITESKQATYAIYLFFVAAGALTLEAVQAKYPGVDFAALADDPDVLRDVAALEANTKAQALATDMVARRNVADALQLMRKRLEDPECPASVAKDIADLSLKQAANLPPLVAPVRRLARLAGVTVVHTPLGSHSINGKGMAAAVKALEAMRPTSPEEFEAVLRALAAESFGGGASLDLPGY